MRTTLEMFSGPVTGNCRADQSALDERIAIAGRLDLDVQVVSRKAEHVLDVEWVVGHLGSAMRADHWSAAAADLTGALQAFAGQPMVERVSTTALIARRRS